MAEAADSSDPKITQRNNKPLSAGDKLWQLLPNEPMTRRRALSTMGKAAIGAAAVVVVGGVGYYALTSQTTAPTTTTTPAGATKPVSLLTQDEPLTNALLKIDAAQAPSAIGVQLNPTQEPFNQMAPTLTAMSAGGNIPFDIVSIAHDQAGPYVPYFRSLDDLIDKNHADLSVFTPALVEQLYKRDKTTGRFGTGNHLGIPYISAPWGLLYNSQLFKQAGLTDSKGNATPPDSWDKFVQYMKELTKPPQQYGLAASYSVWWNPAWMHTSYVSTNGGSVLDSNYRPKINDALNVQAVQFWSDAVNVEKYAQPTAITTDDAGLTGLYNSGGAAGYIYWFTTVISSANDPTQSKVVGQSSAAALPGGKVPAGGWAHFMPQTETNADAAFKYMMWESTNEVQGALNTGDLSFVRTASFNDPSVVAKYPYSPAVGQIAANGYAEPSFDIAQGSQLWTAYLKHFQDVVSGAAKAQAAMDACFSDWDGILKKAGYYQ